MFFVQEFSWRSPALGASWSGEDGTPEDRGRRVAVWRDRWSDGRLGSGRVVASEAKITPQEEVVIVFRRARVFVARHGTGRIVFPGKDSTPDDEG